jgi:N-acetylglucosamine kinase-like BadF-type ATPase
MNQVIAADGGNSKTDLVVADLDGHILARVAARGTRSHRDGMAATMAELVELARLGIERAGVDPASIRVGAFYLANIDLPDDEAQAAETLAGYRLADRLSVHNDVFAVLRAGTSRDWGVAVTSGAGVNAVGVGPDGEVARFLSLGDYTGDWGGGHAVGIAGLGAAIRAGDGRGPDTKLRDLIAARFGRPDVEAVAVGVHRNELSYSELLTLSPLVFQCASDGDEVAIGIVHRLGAEVSTMAIALLRRLRLLDSDADVVLGGGTLQSGNRVLLDDIQARLADAAPNVGVRVLDVPPVTGPLIDALTLAGAGPAAIERLRAEITSS